MHVAQHLILHDWDAVPLNKFAEDVGFKVIGERKKSGFAGSDAPLYRNLIETDLTFNELCKKGYAICPYINFHRTVF